MVNSIPITAVDVIFTGSCNMQCSYCFIHKNPQQMHNYNTKVREALANGSYAQNVIDAIKDHKENLDTIALWGGEPTVNADLFRGFIEPLLDYFTKVKSIHFSTNGSNSVLPFAETLYDYHLEHPERLINLDIQFSIDGPPHINEKSRQKGATANTWKHVSELVQWADSKCNNTFRIASFPKATLDEDDFAKLADGDNLYNWFKFFDDWGVKLHELCPNKYVRHMWCAEPSFTQPSHWTSNFPIAYSKIIDKVAALNEDDFTLYHHPFIHRTFPVYLDFAFREPNSTYPVGSVGCNGGLHHYTVDYEGVLMTCHHCYDNFNLGLGTTKAKNLLDYTTAVTDFEKTKMQYVQYLYHDSINFRRAHIYALVLIMIKAGEIDSKYAEPFWFDRLFLFMSYEAHCWLGEAMEETQSVYLTDIGSIRIYCHGALEKLVDYYEKYKSVYAKKQANFGI